MTDKLEITFVNSVAVSGHGNGVVNLAFTTAAYLPNLDRDGKRVVDLAEFVSANLRMDLFCAQQLHDSLASILAQQTAPGPKEKH